MGRVHYTNFIVCITTWTLLCLCAAITTDDCPKSLPRDKYLKVFANSCFRFELHHKKNYYSAQKYCEQNGGLLAMPKSKELNNFLTHQMRHSLSTLGYVWIGLNDLDVEGSYKWIDGTPMTSAYNNFDFNQGPHNWIDPNVEDCVILAPFNGKWHDYKCKPNFLGLHFKFHFICEFPAQITAEPTTTTIEPTTTSTTTEPTITTTTTKEATTTTSTKEPTTTTTTEPTTTTTTEPTITTTTIEPTTTREPTTTAMKTTTTTTRTTTMKTTSNFKVVIPKLIEPTPGVISVVKDNTN